jgi:hypothetical protein
LFNEFFVFDGLIHELSQGMPIPTPIIMPTNKPSTRFIGVFGETGFGFALLAIKS